MNNQHPEFSREGGNAVTLTLLGLAVAILAGVAVLYWLGNSAPVEIKPVAPSSDLSTSTEMVVDPRAGWQTYTDDTYEFSIQFPPGWLVATGTVGSVPVITIAPGALRASSTEVYHSAPTRVSVYPHGTTHANLGDTEQQSTVIITIPQAVAKDYQLSSKRPWATIGRFAQPPASWTADGIIFAQVLVEDEMIRYLRGDGEISLDAFDRSAGDTLSREGYVDPTLRGFEEEILRSFQFLNTPLPPSTAAAGLPIIERPKNDERIVSPMIVTGTAPARWYFEGSFPVRLETIDGTVLAEVSATAQNSGATDELAPFELSIVFPATTATSGVLVLQKGTPSGLTTEDGLVRIPVVFATP